MNSDEQKELEEMKRKLLKALFKNEMEEEKKSKSKSDDAICVEEVDGSVNKKSADSEKQVTLKKEPTAIAMRIFKDTEDYETQLMRECEAFRKKHGMYPNAIVTSPDTLDRWQDAIMENAAESEAEDFLEELTFDEIRQMQERELEDKELCRIGPSDDGEATVFTTRDYELYVLENQEYQDGVYQLFNGYSPSLCGGEFRYPVIDMVETGKKIRSIMDEQGITPTEVQNVCGLGSLQAVYKWFVGKSVPSIDNLGILSNLLNVPIDDIVVFKNRGERI